MKKFFIILSLLTLFSISIIISYNLNTKTQKNVDHSKPKQINKEHSNSNTSEMFTKVNYDILGSSNNYPDEAMTKWRKDVVTLAYSFPSSLYINGNSNNKVVALTFDDGPDSINTPNIVDILHKNNVQATFFCIGSNIEKNKTVIQQAFNDGNLIENHSWSHKDLTKINEYYIDQELTLTENEIYNVIGKKPAIIRTPYGSTNSNVQNIIASKGYINVLWSIDTLDWDQKEVTNITKNVLNNIRPGEIILMHCDGGKQKTVEALPIIITELKKNGYNFETLDKLLNCPAYK